MASVAIRADLEQVIENWALLSDATQRCASKTDALLQEEAELVDSLEKLTAEYSKAQDKRYLIKMTPLIERLAVIEEEKAALLQENATLHRKVAAGLRSIEHHHHGDS